MTVCAKGSSAQRGEHFQQETWSNLHPAIFHVLVNRSVHLTENSKEWTVWKTPGSLETCEMLQRPYRPAQSSDENDGFDSVSTLVLRSWQR